MNIDFSKASDGLVPVIVQDNQTLKVLMLGYMNPEALTQTISTKKVTFYSRSKKRLWVKGETSGNFLNVVSINQDCDDDTILIKVAPEGPVCHTGSDTCFNEENRGNFLFELEATIQNRKKNPQKESYTNQLFNKGINKIAQKVGEEAVELVIEAKDDNKDLFLGEAADLMYHYLVLLAAKGYSLNDVTTVLNNRNK
ncbi:MAG: bifunctional phosphoribosyl-AMP cyclohydrolase/phosphoribosyl-ATP diphosphatase HisIE [Sphingobacteriaceae bacterium]|nr:bifunctional phosphoribosyl-AMP cyclohydrolase/phosphoribosyl-ATP diphosphatase HisIE [Sphingobacteriaceae bacterium]